MLDRLRQLFARHGYLSGIVIDESEGMPSSGACRHRFGNLLLAYALVGFTPDRDFRCVEVNRALRAFHHAVVADTGAGIGGMVGSAAGSVIDSWLVSQLTPAQRIEGARLDDLRITSASEGGVLPRVYGRMRVGGNIIWATEYLYTASFALALCEGPIQQHWPHLGRRQPSRSRGHHASLVSGRRDAVG